MINLSLVPSLRNQFIWFIEGVLHLKNPHLPNVCSVDSLIRINRLLESVSLCPKVIPLSGSHCISNRRNLKTCYQIGNDHKNYDTYFKFKFKNFKNSLCIIKITALVHTCSSFHCLYLSVLRNSLNSDKVCSAFSTQVTAVCNRPWDSSG